MLYICSIILLVIIIFIIVFALGFMSGLRISNKEVMRARNSANKNGDLLKIAIKWIRDGQKIEQYIEEKGYKRIAVYGMSYLGDCLVDTLWKKEINVVCGIDRNADRLYNPYVPIYKMENDFPMSDVIIVTALVSYQQIKQDLQTKLGQDIDIISLEDILY